MANKSSKKYVQLWCNRIAAWKKSGLGMAQWCHINQLKTPTFYYWYRKLRQSEEKAPEKLQSLFIELKDCEGIAEEQSGITIQVAGISLQIAKKFDEQVLVRCLEILKRNVC